MGIGFKSTSKPSALVATKLKAASARVFQLTSGLETNLHTKFGGGLGDRQDATRNSTISPKPQSGMGLGFRA